MADLQSRAFCTAHEDRLAVALCDHCSNPLCERCRTDALPLYRLYCSKDCAAASEADALRRVREDAASPIRRGWALWARSLKPLSIHVAPMAAVIALIVGLGMERAATGAAETMSDAAVVALLVVVTYGIGVVGIILSHTHIGEPIEGVFVDAFKRYVPWGLTWLMFFVASTLGYFLFVIPGVILGLRLFWADEYALAHEAGPIKAFRESWRLTGGNAGELFVFQLVAGFAAWVVVIVGMVAAMAFGVGLGAVGDLVGLSTGPGIAFAMAFVGLLGYGALHGPELVKFYGMRAELITGEISYYDGARLNLTHPRDAAAPRTAQ